MLTRRAALAAAAPFLMAAKAKPARTGAPPVEAGATGISCAGGGRSWLAPLATAPFPYEGLIGGTNTDFLDKRDGDRRGHTSPRGGVYWEDATYRDNRVLFSVSPHYRGGQDARIVLFLHGNQAVLGRDVCGRQGIPRQLAASGLNAVLIAPQLAANALDSSAGKFWEAGGLGRFMTEATQHLAANDYAGLEAAPIVIVAYSGGYLPAVFGLEAGNVARRVEGLVLLDALFGEVERYARVVVANSGHMFFVSAYSASSREPNNALRRMLGASGIATGEGLPGSLRPRTATFISAPPEATHNDFMTRGFVRDPMTAVLKVLAQGRA